MQGAMLRVESCGHFHVNAACCCHALWIPKESEKFSSLYDINIIQFLHSQKYLLVHVTHSYVEVILQFLSITTEPFLKTVSFK